MDDKEYYSMMNKMPSSALLAELKKKAEKSKQKKNTSHNSFNHLESRQGREDAEMLLLEKNQK